MNKLDRMLISAKIYGKAAIDSVLFDERGDVNVVSMVALIAVAIVLALVFKDEIGGLIDGIISGMSTNTSNLHTRPTPATP